MGKLTGVCWSPCNIFYHLFLIGKGRFMVGGGGGTGNFTVTVQSLLHGTLT